jgi:hypothetical protein
MPPRIKHDRSLHEISVWRGDRYDARKRATIKDCHKVKLGLMLRPR